METKGEPPIEQLNAKASPLVEIYFELFQLKQLYRQGWLRRGVDRDRCESVAEHSFAVALLTLLVADTHAPEVDSAKAVRMALLHDLGEIHAGDLTPEDGVPRDEKHRRERESVEQVLAKLPRREEYLALWDECAQGRSTEARFVRQMDRLELVLQASVYEHQGLADLAEFFDSVREVLNESPAQDILRELEDLRSGRNPPPPTTP